MPSMVWVCTAMAPLLLSRRRGRIGSHFGAHAGPFTPGVVNFRRLLLRALALSPLHDVTRCRRDLVPLQFGSRLGTRLHQPVVFLGPAFHGSRFDSSRTVTDYVRRHGQEHDDHHLLVLLDGAEA